MKITDLVEGILDEVSLKGFGDYAKKARMSKAMAQMNKGFGYEGDHDKTIAKRDKGLERHKTRVDKFWADKNEKAAADAEAQRIANRPQHQARLAQLEKEFDPDYDYSDDYSHWSKHRDISQQIAHLKHALRETATAGATSASNVGVGAVYKNKPAKQAKNKDGTAKNALDLNANLLTGGSIKR